jgi:hypothetical protein
MISSSSKALCSCFYTLQSEHRLALKDRKLRVEPKLNQEHSRKERFLITPITLKSCLFYMTQDQLALKELQGFRGNQGRRAGSCSGFL